MKVTNVGSVPPAEKKAAWWVGATVKCLNCGFAGEMEEDDRGKRGTIFNDERRTAFVKCPNGCNAVYMMCYAPGGDGK